MPVPQCLPGYSMLFVDFKMVCPVANLNGCALVIDPQGRIKLLLLARVRLLIGGCYCLPLSVTVCLRWVTYGGLFVTFASRRSPVCKFNWSLNGCFSTNGRDWGSALINNLQQLPLALPSYKESWHFAPFWCYISEINFDSVIHRLGGQGSLEKLNCYPKHRKDC